MSSTKLSAFCSKVLEIGWLLAVVITPLFFNVYSSRVFEPDKLTTLRTVATIMAVVWVVKWIEERSSGKSGIAITWRTPLVRPALFTIAVYLLSTLLSVTRWVSFFGSYQRLQGTYTTLSYIVIFFIILQEMRTRPQLDRLITIIILNSLPIALYGFLQHNRLDPLPWGGDVTDRIASNMGNPIFVAAYMIMAAFPTLARVVDAFRAILADEETGTADVLRAAAYIFIFLVQIIAVWFSGSRGPLMGFLAGLGVWAFLGLLTLQRAACREHPIRPGDFVRDVGRGLGFGLGSLAVAGLGAGLLYAAGRAVTASGSNAPQWAAVAGAVLAFSAIWLAFIVNRQGWRWLWAGALLLAILAAAGFLVINLVEPVRAWSTQQPWLGRLDDVLQAEGGTGKVRSLIWEGGLELIGPHEPLQYPPTQEYPQVRPDSVGAISPFLRMLVGYGPESMYVAYNRFYPPLLGHYESRTASPDRSHNETLDSLVITGWLGFAAYLWIFGSIFYFGLRWLGFLPDGWRRILFFAALAVGAAAAVVAVVLTIGPHFFCLAIPVGIIGGLFLYLIVYGFSVYWDTGIVPPAHPYTIILTGLVAAVVAHLIEINFGIAIASTRTTFWAYAGAFAVAGAILAAKQEVPREQDTNKQRQETGNKVQAGGSRKRRKRRKVASLPAYARPVLPEWLSTTLAIAVVGGFILGTLAFDFITIPGRDMPYFTANPEKLRDPVTIIWRAMTVLPNRNAANCAARWDPLYSECRSYGLLLLIFLLTWLMGALVLICETAKSGLFRERKDDWLWATLAYLLTSFIIWFMFALVLVGNHTAVLSAGSLDALISRIIRPQVYYYALILFALLAGGTALTLKTRLPGLGAQPWGTIALIVLAVLAGITVVTTNLHPIQADVIYKQAEPWESSGQWPVAVELYNRAIELAPREDFYHLYLGRALLEYARNTGDSALRDNILQMTEQTLLKAREINPLNTDHSANLARMYSVWAQMVTQDATNASDPEAQQRLLQRAAELRQRASQNYALATMLSPNHATLRNEWTSLYLDMGEITRAQETISYSLELDPDYENSWIIQANVYAVQGLITETINAYSRALAINPNLGEVWLRLGDLYAHQGQLAEAAHAYEKALELDPGNTLAWRVLGSIYVQLQQPDKAVVALERALELDPQGANAWDIHRVLAIAYNQLGQNDTALSHARTALQLAPTDQQPAVQDMVTQLEAIVGSTQP